MKVKIDIETQTFVRFWLVVIGFIVVVGAVFLARDSLITIGIAIFVALGLNPPVSKLAARLPGKSRVGATAIAYLLVVTLLGSIIFLVIPPIIEQTAKFASTVPSLIDKATSQRSVVDDFINHYNLRSAVNQAIENAKSQAANVSTQLGSMLVDVATGALSSVLRLMFILILSFLMLIEGPMWMRKVWELYDDPEKLVDHKFTVERMYRVVTGFVNGQVTVAAIGAAFVCILLLIMSVIPNLGMPANLALPLALMVFIFEIIPMIGAPLATIVVGLVILLNSPVAALVFAGLYIIYQQIEGNVIAPSIQSKSVDLTVLWIIMALLIGSSIFGLIGGLISIPIAGCLRVLLVDYLARARKRREKVGKSKGFAKLIKKVTNDA